jgi:hypothetical protein
MDVIWYNGFDGRAFGIDDPIEGCAFPRRLCFGEEGTSMSGAETSSSHLAWTWVMQTWIY